MIQIRTRNLQAEKEALDIERESRRRRASSKNARSSSGGPSSVTAAGARAIGAGERGGAGDSCCREEAIETARIENERQIAEARIASEREIRQREIERQRTIDQAEIAMREDGGEGTNCAGAGGNGRTYPDSARNGCCRDRRPRSNRKSADRSGSRLSNRRG